MEPIASALFIIALVPAGGAAAARNVLPQAIAVLITAAFALVAIGAGGRLVFWAFGGIGQWVIANAARLPGLYMHPADLLERRGLYAAELFAEQMNVLWLVQVLRAFGGNQRPRRIGGGDSGAAAFDIAREIASRLQTYMVRLGMSVLTGLAFWAFAALYGLEAQREWSVIAFALNFIPFIGSFVATLLPVCLQPRISNRSTPLLSCLSA